MSQGQLSFGGLSKLDVAFEEFHAEHPEVFEKLREMALELVASGQSKLGIGMLWEVMRWHTLLGERAGQYRLNNNLRSRYARRLMQSDERLAGVFDTRELHDREDDER